MRKGQKSRIRASRTDIAVQVIVYMIVIAVCLIIILPCLNVLVLAFNDGKDAARGGIWFWPRVPTFDNIKEVFKDGSIVRVYHCQNCHRYRIKPDCDYACGIFPETERFAGK